ncbi:MAG: polysulfide reductase NrfD [Firmicutes bacterium]|nr:polysulfide reductase NrfD [Bacillota bacterium]
MQSRIEQVTIRAGHLPYGIGTLTPGWYLLISVLLVMFGFGLFAYSQQLTHGEIVTGMRDIGPMGGATWGLYITFVVYFVGVSFAGITTAVMIRLLNLEHLRPISRIAELLTVISLVLAAFSVLVDLGQPLQGLLNLPRYARPGSPFFGTFTLVVSGYLFASLVYLYLDGRKDAAQCVGKGGRLNGFYRLWAAGYRDSVAERDRRSKASFWLGIAILPLLVTAHSTLGFVFGLQVGRPGWYSALQAPSFVVMAGVSGVGLLIVIAAVLRRALGERERLNMQVFRSLGNFLMLLTITYLYLMVVELLTSVYAGPRHENQIASTLLTGDYAWLFWISAMSLFSTFALLFGQYVLHRYNLSLIVLSGILANIAAIGKRYLIVVPSQTHGTLLPYVTGSYQPTWVEYGVILGLFALGVLLYALFIKVFPIIEIPGTERR